MNRESNLTKAEVQELFKQLRETGDKAIREKLVLNFLYLPKFLSQKYTFDKTSNFDDIYQTACIGLIYAVDRYDPETGFEFETFASPTIVGEIKKYYRDKQYLIRIPRKIQELNREIKKARTTLENKLKRPLTITDIADYLNLSEEQIIEALEGNNIIYPRSLSSTIENNVKGQDTLLIDIIGTEDDNLESAGLIQDMLVKIEQLDPIEKLIIVERYYKGKTQREVAELIDKSQMTVSRLEKKVMHKLRDDQEKQD